MALSLNELAAITGARLVGDGDCLIDGVNTLLDAEPGELSFLTNSKYRKQLSATRASAVILSEADLADCPTVALVTPNPHAAYAKAASALYPVELPVGEVHASAIVDELADIDPTAAIGPGCVVEAGVIIGPGVVLGPNCVVGRACRLGAGTRLVASVTLCADSHLGERCLVQPGAVIGGDGFGFAHETGKWLKVPQVGGVRIGNDVEIGANTTVDRGAIRHTMIGDGSKIDNLVMLAHNVEVGEHTVIAGNAGISGSSRIGNHCVLGGGVGLVGHIELADGVTVNGNSLVSRSLKKPGVYSGGVPSLAHDEWQKNFVHLRHLGDMYKRIKALEAELNQLRGTLPGKQGIEPGPQSEPEKGES